ncbi:MAG: uracil-DNA glycosylase family protein [Ginsengibacter sp.]
MVQLLKEIRSCRVCEKYLPLGSNPLVAASPKSKIVIIGSAPGRIAYTTGIRWNDKSGDNLRNWLGVDKSIFYNPDLVASVPMGFCFPGFDKNGDLPPRPECAPLWHLKLFAHMQEVQLILLIGRYAHNYYLGNEAASSLTESVKNYKKYLPKYFLLPHPSPRNNGWYQKNKWFDLEVLPDLKRRMKNILNETSGLI